MKVVPLHNGPNRIDLRGDGHQDLVFEGRRTSWTAHGYNTYTFYVRVNLGDSKSKAAFWTIVPFSGDKLPNDQDSVRTVEGADCLLRDVVVLRKTMFDPVTVVIANRKFGSSYIDKQPVTFSIYRLSQSKNDPYILTFDLSMRLHSKEKYCDVDKAMEKELGIRL